MKQASTSIPPIRSNDPEQTAVQASGAPSGGIHSAVEPPDRTEHEQKRPRSRNTILRLLGSLILLALLAWKLDVNEAAALMGRANPVLTIGLIVLYAFANAYNGARWWLILRLGGQQVPFWPSIRLTLWSVLMGTFLPGLVGVELIRFSVMSRYTGNPAMVFCSVMVDRLFGITGLFVMVLIGCSLSPIPLPPVARNLSVLGIGLATFASLFACTDLGHRLLPKAVPGPLAGRILPKLDKVLSGVRQYRQAGWALLVSAALAIVAHVIRVVAAILADRALGIGLDPTLYFVIIPVAMFLEMLPVSVLGLGIREVSMVTFFGLIGESTETGLALSLYIFITYTISKLPGAVALLLERDDVSSQVLAQVRAARRK